VRNARITKRLLGGFCMAWLLGSVCAQQSFSVHRWIVTGVSSEQWESHPAIDPTNGDLWFVRSDRRSGSPQVREPVRCTRQISNPLLQAGNCGRPTELASTQATTPLQQPTSGRAIEAIVVDDTGDLEPLRQLCIGSYFCNCTLKG
jgi:hypothetical protein